MWIKRSLAPELRSLAETFPALVLTGPRQVGKTALLERTFPEYGYVSLDVMQNAEAAETRPAEFLARHEPPLLIDEIQYAPELLRQIKTVIDNRRDQKGLFLVTGSQSFPLMQRVSESLAGRAAVVPFLGLSATEWRGSGELSARYPVEELLWRGSFPGIWERPDHLPDRDRWFQGYVTTYLERDVRNMLNVGNLRDFERFLRACAVRTGQLLNMSELGRDIGVSPTTARQWISVLHASHQILLLEPYYRSLGKRLTKTPKLYFTDTGLAAYLAGFETPQALQTSPAAGAFWENHVVSQWCRWRDWFHPSAGLWFWQDRMKNEVDLLVDLDQRLYPIECKRKERPEMSDIKGIRSLTAFYGEAAVGQSYIACLTGAPFDVSPRITAVSGWETWELSA